MTTTLHLPSLLKLAAVRLRRIGVEYPSPILPGFLSIADEIGVDVANLDAELGEVDLLPELVADKH